MTLLIQKLETWNTKFPHHFKTAVSEDHAELLIELWRLLHNPAAWVHYDWTNIDSGAPVATIGSVEFYARKGA